MSEEENTAERNEYKEHQRRERLGMAAALAFIGLLANSAIDHANADDTIKSAFLFAEKFDAELVRRGWEK